MTDTSKTAKIIKRWYYSTAHWQLGDVKSGYFTAIGSCSVRTIAYRYRHAAYVISTADRLFRFIYTDDHERPWTPSPPSKKRFRVNLFSNLWMQQHILTLNCDEMAGDRPWQPAYEIFTIKLRFQQSNSRPPTFKEAGAGGRQKRLPPKSRLV